MRISKISIISIFFIMLFGCCKEENINCPTCPSPPTDTTSHNFAWDAPVYFGSSGSSVLHDVAIINDTLAYAVGEIRINDTVYNLAKWNGQTWELKRITVDFRGSMITPPLDGIFAFSGSQIWIAASGAIIYGDDNIWTLHDIRAITGFDALSFTKCWGVSPSLMYFVGRGGSIVHYNGASWTKIESGTSLSINDIWGAYNSTTKQWEILAVAADIGSSSDRKILQIKETSVITLSDSPISWSLSGVWFVPCLHYFVVGSGIYEKRRLSDNAWINNPHDITTYYSSAIRGNTYNDLFVVGAFGEAVHFNGSSWYSFQNTTALANGAYSGIAMIGNLVIVVGAEGPTAVVAIGRRQ